MNRTRFPMEVDRDPPLRAVPVWTKNCNNPGKCTSVHFNQTKQDGCVCVCVCVCVFDDKITISVNGVWWIWRERHSCCFWFNNKLFTLEQKGKHLLRDSFHDAVRHLEQQSDELCEVAASWGHLLDWLQNFLYLLVIYTPKICKQGVTISEFPFQIKVNFLPTIYFIDSWSPVVLR